MKFIYPAVFHKTEEGHYKGYFPDLECCYGEGETLDEAIESANEAARDWITLELSEDEPMIWFALASGTERMTDRKSVV